MFYLIIFAVLFIAELLYFTVLPIGLISSISLTRGVRTIILLSEGGGIIYWFAALLYVVFNPSANGLWFLAGITLMAGVSFWDDVSYLGQKIRLLFHLLAMSCAFYLAGVFGGFGGLSSLAISCL